MHALMGFERLGNLHILSLCQYIPDTSTCSMIINVDVVLLFYVHGKHLRSCRDGQLT